MRAQIVHIVRRFCRDGGMENYVWCLVHSLADLGISISVICESFEPPVSNLISVICVEQSCERQRWRQMFSFRSKVERVCREQFNQAQVIIHSHERSSMHQITTFHGEPYIDSYPLRFLGMLSGRSRGWKKLETEELTSSNVEWVLPVSTLLMKKLLKVHPTLINKKILITPPAVDEIENLPRENLLLGCSCVFVGREWKRKGLDLAIRYLAAARYYQPDITLDIYGPKENEIPKEIRSLDWVRLMGWCENIPWAKYDLLVHPARREPFGMVVVEARRAGLPVFLSDQVGALDFPFDDLYEIRISDKDSHNVEKLLAALALKKSSRQVFWTWHELATLLVSKVYPTIT